MPDPQPTVFLPLDTSPPKAAARLLSVLAYPDSAAKRAAEERALTVSASRLALALGRLPEGMTLEEATAERVRLKIGTLALEKRLQKRLSAAQLAAPFITAQIAGTSPPIGFSELRARHIEELGLDEDNFDTRIWRSSAPVLHLAYAYGRLSAECLEIGRDPSPPAMLVDGGLVRAVTTIAQAVEESVVATFPRLYEGHRLIPLRAA